MYDLDRLDAVHHQMEENELSQAMDEIGYQKIRQYAEPLPNGKKQDQEILQFLQSYSVRFPPTQQ